MAVSLRNTVEWVTRKLLAAPDSDPARATASTTRRSSQFKRCPFLQSPFAQDGNVCAFSDKLHPGDETCKNWRIQMRALLFAPSRKIDSEAMRVFIWPLVAGAAAAALLILIAYWFGFADLDRLVPDGTNFLPYYTT